MIKLTAITPGGDKYILWINAIQVETITLAGDYTRVTMYSGNNYKVVEAPEWIAGEIEKMFS